MFLRTLLILALAVSTARADSQDFHADAEVDPLAFALRGYSLHVGLGYQRLRLDLGAFAADVPEFLQGNKGFDASSNGFGLKLQYFFFGEQRGLFVGVDCVFGKLLVERKHSELGERQTSLSVGAHVGYRFTLPASFYITLWGGAGYEFRSDDITLGGRRYEVSPLAPFAALHVGYRFR